MIGVLVIIIYVLGVVPLGVTVRWPVHIAAAAAAVVAIVAFSFRGTHRLLNYVRNGRHIQPWSMVMVRCGLLRWCRLVFGGGGGGGSFVCLASGMLDGRTDELLHVDF